MPGGSKPGERRGGRAEGTPNKATASIEEKLARLGCDPLEGMARIALNDLPCGVCRGKGKTKYMRDGKISVRICESCYGTLYEACAPELRGKMLAELAQYVAPKRKAIEHSGPGGGPIETRVLELLTEGRARVAALRSATPVLPASPLDPEG